MRSLGIKINFSYGGYVGPQTAFATYQGQSINDWLIGAVEASVMASDCYQGLTACSDSFYSKLAKQHCRCCCSSPAINVNQPTELIGVDLQYPDFPREQSRYLVYRSTCVNCNEPLTHAKQFGSFCSTGLKNLQALAVKLHGALIDWQSV